MSNSQVILQADNGKYVLARVDNGQNGLYAEGNTPGEALELDVIIAGGWPTNGSPKINLKHGDTYVTLHGDTVVLDNGAAENRDFEVTWRGVGHIALKGANGKYVSRETDGGTKLIANRDAIVPWEAFSVITT